MNKKCARLFWVWQEEKEIEWLRQMSQKGWHLENICIFIYTFRKGEPKDIIYHKDYTWTKHRDEEEYLGIFKDAGWNHICRQGYVHYFSSPAENKFKKVYTDNQSRLNNYRGLLRVHVIIIVMLIIALNSVSKRAVGKEFNFADILFFIVFLALVTTAYSTLRMIVLITRLNKNPKE